MLALGGTGLLLLRDRVVLPRARAVFAPGRTDSGWLSWSEDDAGLIIPAEVNGRPVRALVDSGAQLTAVDKGLAEELGLKGQLPLPVVAYGVSGGPQLGHSAQVRVAAGDVAFEGLRAAVLSLPRVTGPGRKPVSLVLGANALAATVLDIDFPRRRLAFRRAGAPPPVGALPVPVRTSGDQLLVPTTVEGRPIELILDTGASSAISLSSEMARAVGLLDGRRLGRTPSITFGGPVMNRTAISTEVRFGDVVLSDVEVDIFPASCAPTASLGLLGVGAFRGRRLWAEFADGRLSLWSEPRPPGRPAHRRP